MLDCIIIGSGIAGISAALTLKANQKSFLIFGNSSLSEKIAKAESIRNYVGFIGGTGKQLVETLKKQLETEEIFIQEERVSGVYALKDKYMVMTEEGGMYESKSVILACGVESVKQIEGEETYLGRGVSYCATCDGFLYKDKTIAVLCTTKRLEHEIGYLAKIAKKIYLIPMYKDVEISGDNITIIRKMPKKIEGTKRVEKLLFVAPPTPEFSAELSVDGIFMLRECVSPAVLVGGLQTESGHVVVGRDMSTNLKGCFAAGDCTGRPYQYAKAAGEGNVAAHSVSEYVK